MNKSLNKKGGKEKLIQNSRQLLKIFKTKTNKGFTSLKKKINKAKKGKMEWRPSSIRLSMKDQTFFAKRLSFLIKANIPVLDSLHMIREQTKSKRYGLVIDDIIAQVSNGQFLSTSLGRYNKTFGDFAVNIINIGERTGILSENLDYLAEELKKRQVLRRKVASAFVYPAIVTAATIGITVFLMVYLFPKIMPVFTSLHIDLPITTRIVIAVSNFMRNSGLLAISVFTLIAIISTFFMRKSDKFHLLFDKTVLKIPMIGRMIQYYNLANISRTLGILLKSGITLSEALPITARTTSNLVYKNQFDDIQKTVNRGERISNHFRSRSDLFPDIFGQIISVGERSGNLPNSFIYISELYEGEVDDFTKNLSSMIEPILMIIMGLLVGFIAISIITPIYGITQNLHP